LTDDNFIEEVSSGLGLVLANANRLYDGAITLVETTRFHAAHVLAIIADEEAAKYLILLDAVRCPKQPGEVFARQLQRFNRHIEKGVYSRACRYRPGTLAELASYLKAHRESFYLDGPNGVDWIFQNDIVDGREGAFYVDYERHDAGDRWKDPSHLPGLLQAAPVPVALNMARQLDAIGITNVDALRTVAEVWRATAIDESTTWHQIRALNLRTVELMNDRGQLVTGGDVAGNVVSSWPFPMHTLDLSEIKVDVRDLRERQLNWGPENF
jgi:AbiV family abortive infection protein